MLLDLTLIRRSYDVLFTQVYQRAVMLIAFHDMDLSIFSPGIYRA